jgi:predicted enzyme related to lactoylglutathione lyase
MLQDHQVALALPATDIERAKKFYLDQLGFKPEGGGEGHELEFRCGEGTGFIVFQSTGAPSGTHTQGGFSVKDLDAEMADLRERGVTFEEYDFPGFKTENGVFATPEGRVAWFKDSEGNLLSINETSG